MAVAEVRMLRWMCEITEQDTKISDKPKVWKCGRKVGKKRSRPCGHVMRREENYEERGQGRNKRQEITEKIRDNETRRLQETRKTTATMRGMCEERSTEGRGRRKVERIRIVLFCLITDLGDLC